MSFVTAQPEALAAAAGALQGIGSSVSAQNSAVAVNTLGISSGSYAVTEAANAAATG